MAKKKKAPEELEVVEATPVKVSIRNKKNFPIYLELEGEKGSIHLLPKQEKEITETQLDEKDIKKHLDLDNILIVKVK